MFAKALKRGVRTASTGTIIVMNPDAKTDERAKYPDVPEADIQDFVDAGLIEDPRKHPVSKSITDKLAAPAMTTATTFDPVAAEAVTEPSQVDDKEKHLVGSSGLQHREALHYETAQGVGRDEPGIAPTPGSDAESDAGPATGGPTVAGAHAPPTAAKTGTTRKTTA